MRYYSFSRKRGRAPVTTSTGFHENLPQSVIDIFAADDEPATSPERDNREAPACHCGAPVYADDLCVAHHQDAFYERVRRLPRGEQFE